MASPTPTIKLNTRLADDVLADEVLAAAADVLADNVHKK